MRRFIWLLVLMVFGIPGYGTSEDTNIIEHFFYHQHNHLVTVQVRSKNQQLIEERTYLDKQLTSILYANGQLITFHYPAVKTRQDSGKACQLVVYNDKETNIYYYDHAGKLIKAFNSLGSQMAPGNLDKFNQLESWINPGLLRIKLPKDSSGRVGKHSEEGEKSR